MEFLENIETKTLFDISVIDLNRYKINSIKVSPEHNKFVILLYDIDEACYLLMENGEYEDSDTFENALIVYSYNNVSIRCGNSDKFDNAWNLQISPKGEIFLLASNMGSWFIFKNGEQIGEYEFIWDLQFNSSGSYAAAIKKDIGCGMIVDNKEWPNFYADGSNFLLAQNSDTTLGICRLVQVEEKDVLAFNKGTFGLVKNGIPINSVFYTIKYPAMDKTGENVAAVARNEGKRFLILQNDTHWPKEFDLAWYPRFHPQKKNELYVPVRDGKWWFLYLNGEKFLDVPFIQLLDIKISENGETLALICSKKFGKFTICVNGSFWRKNFPLIEDVVISPDGSKVLAVVQTHYPCLKLNKIIPEPKRKLILNDQEITGCVQKVLYPKFSKSSRHFVACIKKDEYYFVLVDNNILDVKFNHIFEPIFVEDYLIVWGIINNKLTQLIKKL